MYRHYNAYALAHLIPVGVGIVVGLCAVVADSLNHLSDGVPFILRNMAGTAVVGACIGMPFGVMQGLVVACLRIRTEETYREAVVVMCVVSLIWA